MNIEGGRASGAGAGGTPDDSEAERPRAILSGGAAPNLGSRA